MMSNSNKNNKLAWQMPQHGDVPALRGDVYDRDDRMALAVRCSMLAYGDSAADWPLGYASEPAVQVTDPVTEAQAFLWRAGPQVRVVAFRGSQTARQALETGTKLALTQIEAALCNNDDVRAHAGFASQYIGLMASPSASDAFGDLADDSLVLFTGHSLGGAVAAIAAAAWGTAHPGKTAFVGFGTPRTGNRALAELVRRVGAVPALRVKHACDPVCAAVPGVAGYHHVGRAVHLGPPDPTPCVPNVAHLADHLCVAYQSILVNRLVMRRKLGVYLRLQTRVPPVVAATSPLRV
jgi:hypothetical protein